MGTAQRGAPVPLGRPDVEAYVEDTGKCTVGPKARGQPGGVEAVTSGDEDAELVTAQSVGPCEVMDAGRVVRRQFQKGGGQVGDVHRAADVVGEQDTVAGACGELVHGTLVCGTTFADDQRRTGDDGLRMHEEDPGLGRRLCPTGTTYSPSPASLMAPTSRLRATYNKAPCGAAVHSSAFPCLSELTDEHTDEFLDEVIQAAYDAGTQIASLHALDVLVGQHAPTPRLPHGVMP